MNKTKGLIPPLHTVLKGTLLLSLFNLTAILLPFIGSFILVMIPLPVLMVFTKAGRTGGTLAVLLTLFIIQTTSQIITASSPSLLPFIFFASLGIAISEVFKKNLSIEKTIILCSAFGFSVLFLLLAYHSFINHTPPLEILKAYITTSIKEGIDLYSRMEVSPEQISYIKENADILIAFLTYTSPALAIIGITLIVWLNVISARDILIMNNLHCPSFGDLTAWKTPEWCVWAFIISGMCVIVPVTVLKWAGINGLMVCLMVYFIQGIAIIAYFFKAKRIPRFLRYIFYMLLVFQQYLLIPVILLGLFDLWLNFRKWAGSPEPR